MRYIYSNRNLICVDNISLMEIFQDEIILTLDSGRKLGVFSTKKSDDLEYVFMNCQRRFGAITVTLT